MVLQEFGSISRADYGLWKMERDGKVVVTNDEFENDDNIPYMEAYHPKATARLRAYVAGDLYEGLMTADGHALTKPLYQDIEAIGPDLYMCKTTNCDWVILNGKGEIVK